MTEAGQNEAQQSIIQLRKDIAGLLRRLVARCGGYTRTQEPAIREYAALISDLPALRQMHSQLVAAQEERKFLKELVEMVASDPRNSHYHAANELLKTFNKEEHSMTQPPSPSDVPTSERGEGDCIAAVARALCVADGYDPEELEPGDALGIDGRNRKGEPCHFMWKHYIEKAEGAMAAMPKPESVAQTPPAPKRGDVSEGVIEAVAEALKPFLYDLNGADLHIKAARAAIASYRAAEPGVEWKEAFDQFVIDELGPDALADGKVSIYDAAEKAFAAAWNLNHKP